MFTLKFAFNQWRARHLTAPHSLPTRFIENGGVFKLEFGPKAFIVVSDPVVVRHLLRVRIGPTEAVHACRMQQPWLCA